MSSQFFLHYAALDILGADIRRAAAIQRRAEHVSSWQSLDIDWCRARGVSLDDPTALAGLLRIIERREEQCMLALVATATTDIEKRIAFETLGPQDWTRINHDLSHTTREPGPSEPATIAYDAFLSGAIAAAMLDRAKSNVHEAFLATTAGKPGSDLAGTQSRLLDVVAQWHNAAPEAAQGAMLLALARLGPADADTRHAVITGAIRLGDWLARVGHVGQSLELLREAMRGASGRDHAEVGEQIERLVLAIAETARTDWPEDAAGAFAHVLRRDSAYFGRAAEGWRLTVQEFGKIAPKAAETMVRAAIANVSPQHPLSALARNVASAHGWSVEPR